MSVRGTSAIVWYALYRCGTTARLYVEVVAVVFVVGWMFTLQSQLTYLLTPQNSDISEMTYYVSRGT